jgi:hypothetical protein
MTHMVITTISSAFEEIEFHGRTSETAKTAMNNYSDSTNSRLSDDDLDMIRWGGEGGQNLD